MPQQAVLEAWTIWLKGAPPVVTPMTPPGFTPFVPPVAYPYWALGEGAVLIKVADVPWFIYSIPIILN